MKYNKIKYNEMKTKQYNSILCTKFPFKYNKKGYNTIQYNKILKNTIKYTGKWYSHTIQFIDIKYNKMTNCIKEALTYKGF